MCAGHGNLTMLIDNTGAGKEGTVLNKSESIIEEGLRNTEVFLRATK